MGAGFSPVQAGPLSFGPAHSGPSGAARDNGGPRQELCSHVARTERMFLSSTEYLERQVLGIIPRLSL